MNKTIYRLEPETNCILTFEQACNKFRDKDSSLERHEMYDTYNTWQEVYVEPFYDSEADTLKHIKRVNQLLINASKELLNRAQVHDSSKLGEIEKPLFDKWTPILKNLVYNSPEYKDSLSKLKVALDHHYANNSHHPEYYSNGINGMNLFDLVEMIVDWKAATERTKDGDIRKSVEINGKRFEMTEQLQQIFLNTVNYLWQ